MLVSVTPLGHADGDAEGAAGLVVDYLEGKIGANRRVQRPDPAGSAAGYYADSVEGPGRWTGEGAARLGLAGTVDPEDFRALLVGVRPGTGETLLGARGSAARAAARRTRPSPEVDGDPDELLSVRAAAALIGVDPSYVTRVIRRTTADVARRLQELFVGAPLSKVSDTYLFAIRTGPKGHWRVTDREARRFAAARKRDSAVIGYDLTFSAPKSVSILWATAERHEAAQIAAAADRAVAVGLAYLESVTSIQDASRPRVHGLTAASFTHGTSRNLDPQLHVHAVIANVAETISGEHRALDGRDLFAHAKTAGYLAAAELRHRTAQRLGWRWGEVVHGLADVEGVPATALAAMSSRKHEIDSLVGELGITSAGGRQVAAYRTRVAKGAADPAELRAEWRTRLAEVGFDDAARARVGGQHRIAPVIDMERQDLLAYLASARGVTEQAAVFDRRDVIQAVASWARDRLSFAGIVDLADEFLASEHAVGLEARSRERSADVIRLPGGRVVSAAGGLAPYSTREMLAAEILVLDAFEGGMDRGVGVAPPEVVEPAIAARATLGPDQAAMVRALCGSGDHFQCAVGPAGSGKTFALDAARQAWEATGYQVLGATDQGTAAEVLGRGAGMRAETLAYWLTRLDTDSDPARIMGPRTVLVVDEASTASTRSLARLFAHARHTGTAVRLVGDPAQHAAVGAGGTFRALVSAHPERTPELSALRRQEGHDMRHVRMALRDYRDGKIADALTRLVRDDRVVLAESADELLDRLVADWWRDRHARQADPTRPVSSMVAEHHRERRALNARARTLLAEAGELAGPTLVVAGQEFRRGDEVICRTPAKELHPPGQRARFVRNGTRGVIIDAQPATDTTRGRLVVDFADRGAIEVPMEFLSRRLRPGVLGGLTHSYALTSYAAQGDTYDAARTLATDASSRPGLYVGLTRGRSDSRLYAVRRRDLDADREREDHMPRLDDAKSALQAVTDRLTASSYERLASSLDRHAATVGDLRAQHDLAGLIDLHRYTDGHHRALVARAVRAERDALTMRACIEPAPELLARYGPRPPSRPDRDAWDCAVSARTLHDVLHKKGLEWSDDLEALGFPDPHALAAADREVALRTRRRDLCAPNSEPPGLSPCE